MERRITKLTILSCVGWYAWQKWWVLVQMMGIISTLVTSSLNHIYIQRYCWFDFHSLQSAFAHALGFSVSISCLLDNWRCNVYVSYHGVAYQHVVNEGDAATYGW
jgi:hypothetical protein